jgi:hypothetical protein
MTKKQDEVVTDVAIMDGSNVPAIIKALEAKIKSLDHVTDSKYKTNGKLEGLCDVKTETNLGNLIKAFSSVKGRSEMYNEAAAELGLDTFPVWEVNGGSLEDWKADITLRINIINHKDTLDKLNAFKAKFEKFLSAEDQKSMLMNELTSFLKLS